MSLPNTVNIDPEKVVSFFLTAIPKNRIGKISYEEAIGIISARWYILGRRVSIDTALIGFLLVYFTKNKHLAWFTEDMESRVIHDFTSDLNDFSMVSPDLASSIYHFYQKKSPLEAFFSFLPLNVQNKTMTTYRMLSKIACMLSGDIDSREFNHVMTTKSPAPRLLNFSSPATINNSF